MNTVWVPVTLHFQVKGLELRVRAELSDGQECANWVYVFNKNGGGEARLEGVAAKVTFNPTLVPR